MPRQYFESAAYSRKRSWLLLSLLLPAALLCVVAQARGQQQQSNSKAARLSRIEWTGLVRYSPEQATAASGLQIGQTIDTATLDTVAQKLLNTGLFKNLSYRYRTNNNEAVVTFVVEEARGGVPVVFDNFVWFTEEELREAVKGEVPGFDGTAPETGGVTETITKALEQLLRGRKIEGTVEYTPSADPSGGNAKHVFVVRGVPIPICSLSFPGASGIQEKELVKNSKPLFENDYSQEFVKGFAVNNLVALYTRAGHLRARFLEPAAKLASDKECRNGVAVTIPVEEGLVYNWNKALWQGQGAMAAPELDDVLGMRAGEVANSQKISEGLEAITEAYGKRGFIMAKVAAKPEFDDANRRVTYHITVNEGTIFRMGSLVVKGLQEADAERLKSRWKLKTGEIYDATYIKAFLKTSLQELMAAFNPRPKSFERQEKPNRQNSTMEVVLTFK